MKTKKKFLFIILIALTVSATGALGQTMYIKSTDGHIMDTIAYSKQKNEKVEKMKKIFPTKEINVVIDDNFKEIKRTKDSLIYIYNWDIKIEDAKTNESKSFASKYYINKAFPMPSLITMNDKRITIKSLNGKPTLINFWFTNCKPCIDEMPVLNRIKSQFKESVNFLAITYEPTKKVQSFLKKHKFNFTQIANAKKFIDSTDIHAFPVNVFLDKNGIVKKITNGIPYIYSKNNKMKMGDGKEFISTLRELINK